MRESLKFKIGLEKCLNFESISKQYDFVDMIMKLLRKYIILSFNNFIFDLNGDSRRH